MLLDQFNVLSSRLMVG